MRFRMRFWPQEAHKRLLLKNTFFLYLLRFSSYFFGFIAIMIQTRVLGSLMYGKVGVANALMVYFQLLIDFGFILSATQDIAQKAEDREEVSRIYSAVQWAKIFLVALSFLILGGILLFFPSYRQDAAFYLLFLLGTAINGFIPDFVYRGLQQMAPVTFRTVLAKGIFTVLIFVFLRRPEDYMVVPLLSICGNGVALIWSIHYLHRSFQIRLRRVSWKDFAANFKLSSGFFISRIAGTAYSSFNVLLVRSFTPQLSGIYAAGDKLLTTGQNALTPISDSIYPYMVSHRDFKLIYKVLRIFMPIIGLACLIGFVYAEGICKLIFGPDFARTGPILRGLIPAAFVTLPDFLFGFPCMSALGIARHANYSIYVSSSFHICAVAILYFCGVLSPFLLACMVSLTTCLECLYRVLVVLYYTRRKKPGELQT